MKHPMFTCTFVHSYIETAMREGKKYFSPSQCRDRCYRKRDAKVSNAFTCLFVFLSPMMHRARFFSSGWSDKEPEVVLTSSDESPLQFNFTVAREFTLERDHSFQQIYLLFSLRMSHHFTYIIFIYFSLC